MTRTLLTAALLLAAVPIAAARGADRPHVTLAQARTLALKVRPGVVKKAELEHEKGGSGLRYSFDISVAGVVYEVGVDARTGRILENGRG